MVFHRCASSKHLQTRRFLDTLQGYLIDIQRILIQLHLSANPKPEPFVDHAGVLRDSKTGRPVNGHGEHGPYDDEDMMRTFMRILSLFSVQLCPAHCTRYFCFSSWVFLLLLLCIEVEVTYLVQLDFFLLLILKKCLIPGELF